MSGPAPGVEPSGAPSDESTLGGYIAAHARPPAFGAPDGNSYTVEMLTDATGDAAQPVGGYLLFVCWGGVAPMVRGHIESGFLAAGASEEDVRAALGRLPLTVVKRTLDRLIREGGAEGSH